MIYNPNHHRVCALQEKKTVHVLYPAIHVVNVFHLIFQYEKLTLLIQFISVKISNLYIDWKSKDLNEVKACAQYFSEVPFYHIRLFSVLFIN